jgi:hypothetical protein
LGQIFVAATRTIEYDLKFVWNDKLDPNPKYEKDIVAADILKKFYNPKNYEAHISWMDQSEVHVFRDAIWSAWGYPFDKADVRPWEPGFYVEDSKATK